MMSKIVPQAFIEYFIVYFLTAYLVLLTRYLTYKRSSAIEKILSQKVFETFYKHGIPFIKNKALLEYLQLWGLKVLCP